MTNVSLKGDYITLAQALKRAGLTDSGGRAKLLVREGKVLVNGEIVTQPGRKLRAGDRFQIEKGTEWTVGQ